MKVKKIIGVVLLILISLIGINCLTSCTAIDSVKHNIINDTDNFKTYRKITVINLRSDKILMEFEGYLSTKVDTEGDVNIIIMTGPSQYKLHYVHLANEIVYLCEQIENTSTDPYHWNITIFAVIPTING